MSDDNADTEGYVLAADYADKNGLTVEDVIQQLKDGTLDGRIIKNNKIRLIRSDDSAYLKSYWYVKKDATISEGSGTGATKPKDSPRSNIEGQANQVAQVRTVQVTGISIPFGDVLMLSFQGLIAGLIIVVPIAFIISVMVVNS